MDAHTLSEWDMIIRLALGFVAGTILGVERASRHQVAGMRTHILITMGATLLMLLSIWLPVELGGLKSGDPGRIAAQVVSGIGFLGAGAIIRLGNNVRGLTTAASLWFAAALGLTIGGGMFIAAGVAEAVGLFTLVILGKLEHKIFPVERLKILEIIFKSDTSDTDDVLKIIKSSQIRLQSMDIFQGAKSKRTKLRLLVAIPTTVNITSITQNLKAREDVAKVEIKEKY